MTHARTFRLAVTLAALATAAFASAQPKPTAAPPVNALPPADSQFSLTVYSTADPALFDPQAYAELRSQGDRQTKLPGYGVVREIRKIDLAAGDNTIRFTDVAASIDPTTVSFRSLTAPDSTSVVEQNYEYDLVSPDRLLEKYVGQSVIINRRQEPLKDDKSHTPETIEGKLLSYDGNTFVLQTDNKRLPLQIIPRGPDISEIKLFDLKTGLITKPTLVWRLKAEQPGKHDAQVTYQTDQITWRADYSVIVNKDETAADVGAWVTLVNQSGASYPDAKLKLIAGDVRRLKPSEESTPRRNSGLFGGGGAGAPQFTEKSFFEYHLYTLARPTSVADNSTKQIELFPTKSKIPVTKTFVYYGLPEEQRYYFAPSPNLDGELGTQSNKKVDIYLAIINNEKNGLGVPLPAGRIRAYKQDDADGLNEFIGEDVIQHTPKDEKILVRLGSAFDIVGDRAQTDFKADHAAHWITESFQIKVRNHKKEPVDVIIRENLFRWSNWEITEISDKFEKQDYRTIHVPVDVPADGEKTVTYTVKYTW